MKTAVFEPLWQYDVRAPREATITEIATIVSQCQSYVWDSRKSCSVSRALNWELWQKYQITEVKCVLNCVILTSSARISNPAPDELPSCRFQLQPQSNTPEAANQGVQGYLVRSVGLGLELKCPQISIRLSICGMYWTNKSNLTTCRI